MLTVVEHNILHEFYYSRGLAIQLNLNIKNLMVVFDVQDQSSNTFYNVAISIEQEKQRENENERKRPKRMYVDQI